MNDLQCNKQGRAKAIDNSQCNTQDSAETINNLQGNIKVEREQLMICNITFRTGKKQL